MKEIPYEHDLDELTDDLLKYRLYSFPLSSKQKKVARNNLRNNLISKYGKAEGSSIFNALEPFWNDENNRILTESFYYQFYSHISSLSPVDIKLSKNLPNEFFVTLKALFGLEDDEKIKEEINQFFNEDVIFERNKNYEMSRLKTTLLLFFAFYVFTYYLLGISLFDPTVVFNFVKHLCFILIIQVVFLLKGSPEDAISKYQQVVNDYNSMEEGDKKRQMGVWLEKMSALMPKLEQQAEGNKLLRESHVIPILELFALGTALYLSHRVACVIQERRVAQYTPFYLFEKKERSFLDIKAQQKADIINVLSNQISLQEEQDKQMEQRKKNDNKGISSNKKNQGKEIIKDHDLYNINNTSGTKPTEETQIEQKKYKRKNDPYYVSSSSAKKEKTEEATNFCFFWKIPSEDKSEHFKALISSEPRHSFPPVDQMLSKGEKLSNIVDIMPCLYFELRSDIIIEINPVHFKEEISDYCLALSMLSLAMGRGIEQSYIKDKQGYILLDEIQRAAYPKSKGRQSHTELRKLGRWGDKRLLFYVVGEAKDNKVCVGDPKLEDGARIGH